MTRLILTKRSDTMKKILRILSALFFILFAVTIIYITIFHVPKYAEYRDGNTNQRIGTGYYNISDTYKSLFIPTDGGKSGAFLDTDLQIDYQQWLMITFVEGVVLLLPAVLLYKFSKDK